MIASRGSSLLKMHGSLFGALQKSYPEISWKKEWFENTNAFPRKYWMNEENHRSFLDQLAKKHKVKEPSDWGKVTTKDILESKGKRLLDCHGTFFNALQSAYPDVKWQREWFPRVSKYPEDFWKQIENRRIFLDAIAAEYHIKQPHHWQRITRTLIVNKGGRSLLTKYKNSMVSLLREVYPQYDWRLQLTDGRNNLSWMSGAQHNLWKFLKSYFPNEEIIINYKHPDLISPTNNGLIELDIWIPKWKLAFEYHGMQHFREAFNKDIVQQKNRDVMRRKACSDIGITLIEIPYWWDLKEESVLATLLQSRNDLANVIDSDIVRDPWRLQRLLTDKNLVIPPQMKFKDSDFMMLSKIWHSKIDPTGWWDISNK